KDLGSTRGNSTQELLPGVAMTFDLSDRWQLLAGVHKGFSPLGGGATEQQEPETSTNYETGIRFGSDELFAELVGFYSDFSAMAENCSVASPCSNGSDSGTFVTGEAVVAGVEFQLGSTFAWGQFSVPVHLSYTHTSAEITADNSVSGARDGDELANVPANMFSLRVELDNNSGWRNYAVAKYTDEVCVALGCNRSTSDFAKTESLFVVDLVSRYDLSADASVYLKVENLFDEQVIIARTPIGARPNKPQTASVGVEYRF
ncbi:MAG TPA: TonB-dependent receptor, partial [Cellvibrionaceae bacterium]